MVSGSSTRRGLIVLADGVQSAFAAGAVAELSRGGLLWSTGMGTGLGAQVMALALLGEAAEAERRWQRQAEMGCPLLASQLSVAQERLGERNGILLLPDALALGGWLDEEVLAEHLAPELGGLPGRLRMIGARCQVAVEDLTGGSAGWHELSDASPQGAGALLRAAASFPAGWGGLVQPGDAAQRLLWGGVGAARQLPVEVMAEARNWDLVCGFPVPAAARPAPGCSLLELVQRREEVAAAASVQRWLAGPLARCARVIVPTVAAYLQWAQRDTADLGVEYPLPWERNGELARNLIDLGAWVARRSLSPD